MVMEDVPPVTTASQREAKDPRAGLLGGRQPPTAEDDRALATEPAHVDQLQLEVAHARSSAPAITLDIARMRGGEAAADRSARGEHQRLRALVRAHEAVEIAAVPGRHLARQHALDRLPVARREATRRAGQCQRQGDDAREATRPRAPATACARRDVLRVTSKAARGGQKTWISCPEHPQRIAQGPPADARLSPATD